MDVASPSWYSSPGPTQGPDVPSHRQDRKVGPPMNHSRKLLISGFGAIAVMLALSSVAFACTVFRGTFTVTPAAPGSGSVTATGNNSGMGYCGGGSPSGTAIIAAPPGNFTATVAPATSCLVNGSNKLSAGVYTLTWNPGSTGAPRNDCMNPDPDQIGEMTVDLNGNTLGPNSYSLNQAPGDYQICISNATGGQGNQVGATVSAI